MEVILKTDVANLGKALDIVRVKDGYARNYLIPRKLAVLATRGNKVMIEKNREKMEAIVAKERAESQVLANNLSEVSVSISRKIIEGEKIFGSVSAGDIADQLKSQGFRVEKRQIILAEAIKQLGVYTITVRLDTGIESRVKVWVVEEDK
jgi:large subunit ribosomal protein L9